MTEKQFDVKRYFEWFDSTKKLIEDTPEENLGWMKSDLTVIELAIQMKALGASFDKDSFLARRFNRDGTPKPWDV